jgi:AbrB family looped-hinge helix DNA binding protein
VKGVNTMAEKVKLSSKYQIVIPKEARKYAGLKTGDKLMVEGTGGKIILWKAPADYTEYMAGLHKEIWKKVDVEKYISALRKDWVKRKT